jgi:hypothetical protein
MLVKARDKDRSRFVVNFSRNGSNHDSKRESLLVMLDPFSPSQMANICSLIENAHILFPNKRLLGLRHDIDGAFHRLKYSHDGTLLCASHILIDEIENILSSSVAVTGDQDVNYWFNQLTFAINELNAMFAKTFNGSFLRITATATDDLIAFGSTEFTKEIHDYMGLIIGDGREPGICSTTSAI